MPIDGTRRLLEDLEYVPELHVYRVERGYRVEFEGVFSRELRSDEVLRVARLAQFAIPDGCERGPWIAAFSLFKDAVQPKPTQRWQRTELSWLPASRTIYEPFDIDGGGGDTCCSVRRSAPSVDGSEPPAWLELLASDEREWLSEKKVLGPLPESWHGHPAGSLVIAEEGGGCSALDLPEHSHED